MSGSSNDECPTCGAKLPVSLRDHASHASRQAFGKRGEVSARGRRDPGLLRHAQRLEWSANADGTMRGVAVQPVKK